MKGGIIIYYYDFYNLYRQPQQSFIQTQLKDYGPNPLVINMENMTKKNPNYRVALWTGNNLQLTLMSIEVGGDIGLEIHPHLDQFIRIEEGEGIVRMGKTQEVSDIVQKVGPDFAFIIPAGTWHNLINAGNKPIKLYSIYAPVQHPYGTIQPTKPEITRYYLPY